MRYFWEKLLQQIGIQEQCVLHREGGQAVGAICGAGLITPEFVLSQKLMLSEQVLGGQEQNWLWLSQQNGGW